MSLSRLEIMYGHLEAVNFARDPTGYLSIDAGIFERHGLDVSWRHVQGTEERYRRLESGAAHLSLVVGRASLRHFLDTRTTRIIGSAMNTCPYYLVADRTIKRLADLKGRTLACKESPARGAPLAQIFQEKAALKLGEDVALKLVKGDQDAFGMLINGEVTSALLPRPYGFIAEEKGFRNLSEWPGVVDDPLPITIETTAVLLREKEKIFGTFLKAHGDGIRYVKAHREEAIRMLSEKFGHSPALAAKTYGDYFSFLDERLTVDFRQFEKLLAQVAPDLTDSAKKLASDWILPSALQN